MKMQKNQAPANRRWIAPLSLLLVLSLAIVLFSPWSASPLTSHPHPAQSYEEALQRIAALRSAEAVGMNPQCLTQFMTHGQKVQQVIVLVHGYTNCPAQFTQLGQRFYDLGYNVLIVPLPHHGLVDRMTDEQSQLAAAELADYADRVLDIANGLGNQITMMGISAGGVVTAWAAQNRKDLSLAVIISPAFGFKQIPTPLTAAVMKLYLAIPNSYQWWDPVLQAAAPPSHAYPRYSTRALAETLQLGFGVQQQINQSGPATRRIIVITNANDPSVNNALTSEIVAVWKLHGANLSTEELPASLGLGHDFIDPEQPDQRIDLVYPQLIEWVSQ